MVSFDVPPERDPNRLELKTANIDVSCYTCLHSHDDEMTFEAFTDGISSDILTGQKLHDRNMRAKLISASKRKKKHNDDSPENRQGHNQDARPEFYRAIQFHVTRGFVV